MQTEHVVARCLWDHSFDAPSDALALQDFISRWSHTVLHEELASCFGDLCPSGHAWRIEELELDLGRIWLDELAQELPRRLSAALREALQNMLLNRQVGGAQEADARLLDSSGSMQEFIGCFLSQGMTPWWYTGARDPGEVWDQEASEHAPIVANLVRDLGRREHVRRRLVWQFGEQRVRQLIFLLEPWHGGNICAWADQLFSIQAGRRLPETAPGEFRRETWLLVLTHLLCERGSLFNTVAFARGVLQGVAQRYRMNYLSLIGLMHQAASVLHARGEGDHLFFKVIEALVRHDRVADEASAQQPPAPDYWSMLRRMLRHRNAKLQLGSDTLQLNELFSALAQDAPERMASLLREEGRAQTVREGILKHFEPAQLEQLVAVLEPSDHGFIVAYAEQAQSLGDLRGWDRIAVWQVLLGYLLLQRGPQFSRRQFTHQILLELCKRHGLDYGLVLDLLIHANHVQFPQRHRFELQDILLELRVRHWREQGTTDAIDIRPDDDGTHAQARVQAWRAHLLRYLGAAMDEIGKSSSDPDQPPDARHLAALPGFRALFPSGSSRSTTALASLLDAPELRALSDGVLAMRLVQFAGAGNLAHLMAMIEPQAGSFCFELIECCRDWVRTGRLPALASMDLGLQLAACLIQALPGFRSARQARLAGSHSFGMAAFRQRWLRLLQREAQVDAAALAEQLTECAVPGTSTAQVHWAAWGALSAPQSTAQIAHGISQAKQPHIAPATAAMAAVTQEREASAASWSTRQLLRAVGLHLRASGRDVAARRHVPPALAALPLFELWALLGQRDEPVIRNWMLAHPQKSQLVRRLAQVQPIAALARSHQARWPAELGAPEECLSHWSSVLRGSGQWQGASALLEQQLTEIMWAVSLESGDGAQSPARLLVRMAHLACQRLGISRSSCIASLGSQPHVGRYAPWQAAYRALLGNAEQGETTRMPPDAESSARQAKQYRQDMLGNYLDHPRLAEIVRHLLREGRVPGWLNLREAWDPERLLHDLCSLRPQAAQAMLREHLSHPAALLRLHRNLRFSSLVDAVRDTDAASESEAMHLQRLHLALAQLGFGAADSSLARATLFDIVLLQWVEQVRGAFSPERVLRELAWRLSRTQPELGRKLMQALSRQQALPPTLRTAIQKAQERQPDPAANAGASPAGAASSVKPTGPARPSMADTSRRAMSHATLHATPMRIQNAGMVLLQSYIPLLFSRMGLQEGDAFVSDEARRRALHCLQYLVTGREETAEHHLILNKLLCGCRLHQPVELSIALSEQEKETCIDLLRAVIGHWPEADGSSVDGFRGNWLVRSASLHETPEKWDLIVERRSWDILLTRFPLSYSVVKLPWMEKAIYVTWPT